MTKTTEQKRIVYVLPRVNVSSTWYGEKYVRISKAEFWHDHPDTWANVLELPRPEWLDIFRHFPGTKKTAPLPSRGTLLFADDEMWLRENVNRIVAILFVAGVEENQWKVPADSFRYYGFKATSNPADLVVLNTKTSGTREDLRSLNLLPPLELRGVTTAFRIDTHDVLVRELFDRFDANPRDRLAAGCYHLFRTQFENAFLSPAEQDYAAFCACLEAALDVGERGYDTEIADPLQKLFPVFPDIERWIKGLYAERSVFNHGATVQEDDALKDDPVMALFEFRSRRLNWDVLRHLCFDVIREQLRESKGTKNELGLYWSRSADLMRRLFDSESLWRWIAQKFTQKKSVEKLLALASVIGRFKTSHLWALQNQPPLAGSYTDQFDKHRWLA
jgi:hypothetical protein